MSSRKIKFRTGKFGRIMHMRFLGKEGEAVKGKERKGKERKGKERKEKQ
jgi:hypothetical protein